MMRNPLKRRQFLAAAAATLVAPHARADLFEDAAGALGNQPEAIKLLAPDGCQTNIGPTIKAWKAMTGIGVEVDIVGVDEINNHMTVDHLAGRANYDVALPATFGLADLALAEVIQPLDGILDQVLPADHQPQSLYSHGDIYGGARYGFQTDGDAYLMFYRRDWLEDPVNQAAYQSRHGEELAMPTSWEQLDRQMSFFNEPSKGQYGGALFRNPGYLVWEFWSRMHAKGVLPFDDNLVPQLASDKAVEALTQMIAVTNCMHPDTRSAGLFENWELYASGTTYANIGWGGSQKYFNRPDSPIRGKLAHGLLPGGDVPNLSYFNWGWSYVVPANASSPQVAALFAAFAVSPDVSTGAVREVGGYFDPFQDSHYEDADIIEAYSPEFLKVHQQAMTNPLPDLYLPGHGSYFDKLGRRLNDAFEGLHEPKAILEDAVRDWELVTLDLDREEQTQRWAELRGTYPSVFTSPG